MALLDNYRRRLKPEQTAVFDKAVQTGYMIVSRKDRDVYNLWFRWCDQNQQPHIYVYVNPKYAMLEADQIHWSPYERFTEEDRQKIFDLLHKYAVKKSPVNWPTVGTGFIHLARMKSDNAEKVAKKVYELLTQIAVTHRTQLISDLPLFDPDGELTRKPKRQALPNRLRFKILKRDGYRCQLCGRKAIEDDTKLEIDHKFPVSKGGSDDESNLWTLCYACNQGKRDELL